ncbi:hypothetical protein CAP35_06855 [Chitinophagaceae bacterium IBVUCB1]|nr:hypothetical protein CAP35_06855 [Chitinophagaceae bacterium IBVUCB1]
MLFSLLHNAAVPMDFDFEALYAQYSNVDLLKITRQTDKYQPAAIAAANTILQQREVTQQEIDEVDAFFREPIVKEHYKKHIRFGLEDRIAEFVNPYSNTMTRVNPKLWWRIMLLYLAWIIIETSYDSYLLAIEMWGMMGPLELLKLIDPLYSVLVFYLILKRASWGWILLFVSTGILVMSAMYWLLKYRLIFYENSSLLLGAVMFLIVRITLLFFMWKEDIANYFKVTQTIKRNVIKFFGFLILLFFLIWLFTVKPMI